MKPIRRIRELWRDASHAERVKAVAVGIVVVLIVPLVVADGIANGAWDSPAPG